MDITVPVLETRPGETHHCGIATRCGGTATVATLASKLGQAAAFVGKVGDDALGRYFREDLQRHGVEDLTSMDWSAPTGVCLSFLHPEGERSMVASRGANDTLARADVEKHLAAISASRIVYFTGYSLTSGVTREAILYLAERCHETGCAVWLNPGAPNLVTRDIVDLARRFADALILNLDEARAMTGQNGVEGMAAALCAVAPLAVLTAGGSGCIVCEGGRPLSVNTDSVTVSDTTGAGDAFSAGFICGKLRGLTNEDAARSGNEVALSFLLERQAGRER